MTIKTGVISLLLHGERFIFLYELTQRSLKQAAEIMTAWAADPLMNFTATDAFAIYDMMWSRVEQERRAAL